MTQVKHSPDFGLSRVLSLADDVGAALRKGFHHFVALQRLMMPTANEWYPCGGYMMSPHSGMDYEPSMLAKQAVLFEACKDAKTVLEVGVHGGHSLLLALLANDSSTVVCMDIGAYSHTLPCVRYLQSQFPGRVLYIQGDSSAILPLVHATFDTIHIDGNHSYDGIKQDITNSLRLAKKDTIFILDDYYDGVERAVRDVGALEVIHVPNCAWTNCVALLTDAAKDAANAAKDAA